MESISKINGHRVLGHGYLQPGVNHWIGIFTVAEDLVEDGMENWLSADVFYEGDFLCEGKHRFGKGNAKIIYVHPDKGRRICIHVEGVDKPEFEPK